MARLILTAERGHHFVQPFQWTDDDGDPINLTGYTVFARITVGEVTYNLSIGSGITVVAASGEITIVLTQTQTTALTEHFGDYELYVVNPSGQKLAPLLEGVFYVSD